MVNNDSNYDVTPDKNVTATFTAYYYNGAQKVVVATDTWNNVVIPSRKTNLVYFKWTVPTGIRIPQQVICSVRPTRWVRPRATPMMLTATC